MGEEHLALTFEDGEEMPKKVVTLEVVWVPRILQGVKEKSRTPIQPESNRDLRAKLYVSQEAPWADDPSNKGP